MSYPHPPSKGVPIPIGERSGSSAARSRVTVGTERRPLRAIPLTRRYEAAWLSASGDVETSSRIAPAIPLFEDAFSALARGAVVQTEHGPVAIEDLMPGMSVVTAEGDLRLVRWIGSMMHMPTLLPSGEGGALTRITAEALGQARPNADVILGPRARVRLDTARVRRLAGGEAAFVPVQALADGVGVFGVTPAVPVATYHIALDRHAALRVAGLEVESYHPGEDLAAVVEPRMLDLFLSLFPHVACAADFGPLCLARIGRAELASLWD